MDEPSGMAPLHEHVVAVPANVGLLRRRARRWLAQVVADPDTVDELTLAVSEAAENAVDHAFAAGRRPGTVTLTAECRPDGGGGRGSVVVTVADDGRWLPVADPGYRGRGLALIMSCSPDTDIHTDDGGTRVTLRHLL